MSIEHQEVVVSRSRSRYERHGRVATVFLKGLVMTEREFRLLVNHQSKKRCENPINVLDKDAAILPSNSLRRGIRVLHWAFQPTSARG